MKRNSVVLVTGANSGMGKAACIALAQLGAHIVMLCRNRERGEEALGEVCEQSGGHAELMICDLASLKSIEAFCGEFSSRYQKLDVLINNAGVLNLMPRKNRLKGYGRSWRRETEDGFEMQFGVNHLGHFLLTNRLLPLLKTSAPSRIIIVSSCMYKRGRIHFDDINLEKHYTPMRAYAQSKLANVLFAFELAEKLSGTGVTVNCVDPGIVATNIIVNRETGFGTFASHLQELIFMPPEKGAQTAVYLASSPEVEGASGGLFLHGKAIASCPRTHDKETAKSLWDISARLTGLNYGNYEAEDETCFDMAESVPPQAF